jgi:IrrE N-terminal-like domain
MSRALTLIRGSDVIDQLRELQPSRGRLNWAEAHSVAERQAALLLDLWSIDEPPVPQFIITSVPGVVVDWQPDWPSSAASFDTGSHWQIVVRKNDPRQRQRFSLAHEFKHVLDDPVVERLYRQLPEEQRHDRAEALCNFFAACLLMPRPWIKHDFCGGLQAPYRLARRYYVSTQAMKTRLSELGLTPMTTAASSGNRAQGKAV